MTIAHHERRRVTGGVDTHEDLHVAAVLDHLGRLLATANFPTTRLAAARACSSIGAAPAPVL